MRISQRIRIGAVATAVTATSLLGVSIATASSASAASGSTCTQQGSMKITASNVNLRSGPGTKYRSYGQMSKGTRVGWFSCTNGWDWVNVESGAHKGKWGYVYGKYDAPA
ncbi:SH3 domain-containing protein [Streptomyces sp. NPDC058247]|uniref:SH3 domain-containing protein n=1 Tax=Streptomyces sp. NPDC058247 TaxID=3346401 RepID=UPI0036EC4D21